ncbi:MAG: glucose-1-phosphate thymidylyltransferase RfbA [Muribaculaceae bacterium]|nr:glucose-1-phosphate thymidylyltransferase RfbA [Muribaculaceae bacterium]
MKGIVLAGGSGSRLWPVTRGVSKQMLPVYDKPMVYYPISVLMLAGIRDILIISTPEDLPAFRRLLGDGKAIGVNFQYAEQPRPEGLAQAFIIGADFIGTDSVCLVLGDNIFYGQSFTRLLMDTVEETETKNVASIFAYEVPDPQRYGIVSVNEEGRAVDIQEKPVNPKSNLAVVGLYFYPNSVVDIARKVKPSSRGELEITSVNNEYLSRGMLSVKRLGRGFAWLDTGTTDSLHEASAYIAAVQKRQGVQVAALEEIAFRKHWINALQLTRLAQPMAKNAYGEYLLKLAQKSL